MKFYYTTCALSTEHESALQNPRSCLLRCLEGINCGTPHTQEKKERKTNAKQTPAPRAFRPFIVQLAGLPVTLVMVIKQMSSSRTAAKETTFLFKEERPEGENLL
jgi:hypothetical protein